jgi:AraC family transcriptional regulator
MMAVPLRKVQPILAYAAAHLDEDVSLKALARRAGLSPFQLQRNFAAIAGETPKRYTLRLRLGHAAVLLIASRESVLDVALSCGFQSHEVFCRAFRRAFGLSPQAYRKRGFAGSVTAAQRRTHAAIVRQAGPCIRLFRVNLDQQSRRNNVTYSIEKKYLSPQPVLLVRRRIKRSEIAATIAGALPHIFAYAQQNGIALAGLPFTRYIEVGPGLITIEPGMRIASPDNPAAPSSAAGEVVLDTLPGGPAAATVHAGRYDQLSDAYAAIQEWIEAQGLAPFGPPWECYLNDPTDHPDPQDWKTEVFWPCGAG